MIPRSLIATLALLLAGASFAPQVGAQASPVAPATGPTSVFAPGVVQAPTMAAGTRFISAPPEAGTDPRRPPGIEGVILGDGYGTSLTTLGDVQNDGASDYAVGAPNYLNPSTTTGAVFIYHNTPIGQTISILRSTQLGDGFGYSVAGVGDVNGDGYNDLLVGAPNHDNGSHTDSGRAYLYLGGSLGINTIPAWQFSTDEDLAGLGWSVAWAGDVNRDGYDDWMIGAPFHSNGESKEGAVYLFLGGPGALPTAPAWIQEPDQSNAFDGFSIATAGDVNADGYADILVGAPGAGGKLSGEGAFALFMGAPGGPTHIPARWWFGGQASAGLGTAVSTAGDVNGDGYSDFIVGAPYFTDDQVDEGVARVYLGGPVPAIIAPPTTLQASNSSAQYGGAVGTSGDFNGDGFGDVLVGAPAAPAVAGQGAAYLYFGSSLGISTSPADIEVNNILDTNLGRAVGTLGDLDGRGYGQWGAGRPGVGINGSIEIMSAGAGPTNFDIIAGQGLVATRGWGKVGATMDADGDGYDDLVMGNRDGGSDFTGRGTLTLFRGGPRPFPPQGSYPFIGAAPDWTYEGANLGDGVGSALSNAGDVNGDGYEDIVAGGSGYSNGEALEGEALLFYGSTSGLAGSPVWQTEGNRVNASYGASVAGGGDFNRDGYDDVAVGAPGADQGVANEGLVMVYQGSASGLSHTPVVTLRGNQLNGQFGTSCVIPGDVNNDGFDDLVVGAPYQGVGEVLEGIVYLYLGSPTGIHAPAAQTIQIDVAFANFGRNVARLGDVNHDGYADLVVGAPEFMNGEAAEGEVLVYFGSPAGFVTPASWTLEGNETNLELGLNGLGGGGDYNNDGNGDLIVGWPQSDSGANDGGRVTVYTSTPTSFQPTPILDVPTPGVGSLLGAAVGGMADFNGDGTTDLYYSAPGYGLAEQSEGIVKVRLGNLVGDWNADWPLAAWRTDGTAPIADGTRSNSTTGFNLHATGRSAAGRTRLKLEWEVKPLGTGFDFTGRGTSAWQTTSGASPGVGSKTTFNAAVTGLTPATRYHWRARYRSASPLFPWSPWFGPERITRNERMLSTAGGALPVGVDPAVPDASVLALAGAAPNPFTESAALAFTLPRAGHAVLALYDVSGRLVKTVFDGVAPAGRSAVAWDGRHADGRVAAAGAYFTRLTFEGEERIGKVVRLR